MVLGLLSIKAGDLELQELEADTHMAFIMRISNECYANTHLIFSTIIQSRILVMEFCLPQWVGLPIQINVIKKVAYRIFRG